MDSMDHAATLDILDEIHNRICKIEAAAGYVNDYSGHMDYGGLAVNSKVSKTTKTTIETAAIFSDMINGRIKEYIYLQTEGYTLHHTEYVSGIKTIISISLTQMPLPETIQIYGSELKLKLVSILAKEDWAKGDHRDTHKYVKVIWDALKELGLWDL